MNRPQVIETQLHQLLWRYGLLLLLGLGLYWWTSTRACRPGPSTLLLLLGAVGKTAYFLFHNFRAMAVFRQAFQQFLLLVSLNLSMIALSFPLDFYCLSRVHSDAFSGLRPGSELDLFGQLCYLSICTLISNTGGNLAAATGAAQALVLLERIAGFISTVFIIPNAANYVGAKAKS